MLLHVVGPHLAAADSAGSCAKLAGPDGAHLIAPSRSSSLDQQQVRLPALCTENQLLLSMHAVQYLPTHATVPAALAPSLLQVVPLGSHSIPAAEAVRHSGSPRIGAVRQPTAFAGQLLHGRLVLVGGGKADGTAPPTKRQLDVESSGGSSSSSSSISILDLYGAGSPAHLIAPAAPAFLWAGSPPDVKPAACGKAGGGSDAQQPAAELPALASAHSSPSTTTYSPTAVAASDGSPGCLLQQQGGAGSVRRSLAHPIFGLQGQQAEQAVQGQQQKQRCIVGLEALLAAQRRGSQAGSPPATAAAAAACRYAPSGKPSTQAAGAVHIGVSADGTGSSSKVPAMTAEPGRAPPQQQAAHIADMRTGPPRRQMVGAARHGAATLLQRLIGGCFSGGGQTSVVERTIA